MEPRIVTLPTFHVVGLKGRFARATAAEIPALWGRFAPRMAGVPARRGCASYGLCTDKGPLPDGTPSFEYMAAVEVADLARVPAGLEGVTVPAATYAVFTHDGPIAGIGATIDAVWQRWLPASRLVPRGTPDFERYDERWDPRTASGPVDLYVPVEAPARGT